MDGTSSVGESHEGILGASTQDLEKLREKYWAIRTARGLEVLRYRPALAALDHPQLQKGASFRRRLDDLGLVDGAAREHWNAMLVTLEGPPRTQLRAPLAKLFAPAQMAKLRWHVRAIIDKVLDEIVDPTDVDALHDIVWRIPSLVYCQLVAAPASFAPTAARLSESTLAPILTCDVKRRQESIDAFAETYTVVEGHLNERRQSLGDDFASTMIRQQEEGLLTYEELIYEAISILQASIDNTVHQMALTLGALLACSERWSALVAKPTLISTAVEETFRLLPRFNTIFRQAPNAVELEDVVVPAESWVFVSVRSANSDRSIFAEPGRFMLDRKPARSLQFGAGAYNCLGQTLARLEITELVRALIDRFPGSRLNGAMGVLITDAVTEAHSLKMRLV